MLEKKYNIRFFSFIILFGILSISSLLLKDNPWQGSTQLHTIMESIATILSFFVGLIALMHYNAKKSNVLFLFIGTGFIGTSFLEFYHALVTSEIFFEYFPSPPESLIPWSWIAVRLFLSAFLAYSLYSYVNINNKIINAKNVYILTSIFTILSFIFFAFVPLPKAYYPELFFSRPEELIPAALFIYAFVGFYRLGNWKVNDFEYWLILSLIINIVSQVSFMSFSQHLFDLQFDVAHLLKKLSYIFVLVGLLRSVYQQFLNEGVQADRTYSANENINSNLEVNDDDEKKRFIQLFFIFFAVVFITILTALYLMYSIYYDEKKESLKETAKVNARFIEAVNKFDTEHLIEHGASVEEAFAATISQVQNAHKQTKGMGKTGEFILAKLENSNIIFLLGHRNIGFDTSKPIPFDSNLAGPMQQALSGKVGIIESIDYKGTKVLAATEVVNTTTKLGLVAKVDIDEIQKPFIRATIILTTFALLLVLIGSYLFSKISNPILKKIEENADRLNSIIDNSPFPIMIHAKNGEIIKINKEWEGQTGYTRKDMPIVHKLMENVFHLTTKEIVSLRDDFNKIKN